MILLTAKTGKESLADDIVTIRTSRTGEGDLPLIVSIPKEIAKIMKFEKGQKVEILTDGDQVYIRPHKHFNV
jgi:antitoxin component of MazEF toxin-antitoxin module